MDITSNVEAIRQSRVKKQWVFLAVFCAIVIILTRPDLAQSQTIEKQWHGPQRLSSLGVESAGEAVMVADPYGILHVFWSEVSPEDGWVSLQYATFDGEEWSTSIDLRLSPPAVGIGSYSADVDSNGMLHLAWTEGNTGPIYYMTAQSENADSVRLWSEPIRIGVPANEVRIQVERSVTHLFFTNFWGREPGAFYMRSKDAGESWSDPFWLDPDIPLTDAPVIPQFLSDGAGGLHATWYYKDLTTNGAIGHWIRYAHSLDGGESWSDPLTIDIADEEPDELRLPHPGLAITGDQVHVVWAGTSGTLREHRYSLDRGATWTETERAMGHLHGQGLGGGMVTDAAGRIHFFAQIRWPQGVYHAIWEEDRWSAPAIIYLMARNDEEGLKGRYHAHSVRAGIRAGNQLVVTFTDEAVGPLYVMYHTLQDVPPLSPVPTPAPTAAPMPTSIPDVLAPGLETDGGATFSSPEGFVDGEAVSNFGSPIWLGVFPAIVLLIIVIAAQWVRGRQSFSK
ncbi:MAG: hypothetical protein GY803_02585 [Chloroflexi bacterium]|nr:hypothetical protein [Chloroflexota bacterium]